METKIINGVEYKFYEGRDGSLGCDSSGPNWEPKEYHPTAPWVCVCGNTEFTVISPKGQYETSCL